MSESNSVWNGVITFGLVSISVRLYAAARSEHIALNQLHRQCNTRIRQPLYCPTCERQVERTEIVKGHEYEKDRFVMVNQDEIKSIEPASSQVIEISEFIPFAEVDPIYLDASYYVVPDETGAKAYSLLALAIQHSRLSALGKLTLHQREHVVIIRTTSLNPGLVLHTLYYQNELRDPTWSLPKFVGTRTKMEVEFAIAVIESLRGKFDGSAYRDGFSDRLRELLTSKIMPGNPPQSVAHKPLPPPVIDLADALKRSVKPAKRR